MSTRHVAVIGACTVVIGLAIFGAMHGQGAQRHASLAAPALSAPPAARTWYVLVRTGQVWNIERGPFASAEACLHVSDALNNRDPNSRLV